MSKVRVHTISISLDGFMSGPDQNIDAPIGRGGHLLHEWIFETRAARELHAQAGGAEGADSDLLRAGFENIGATIVGGGASTIQQFLRSRAIDELHFAVVPIFLGTGERLFDDLDGAMDDYQRVETTSFKRVTHYR
jgi:dihydrofolate reductase